MTKNAQREPFPWNKTYNHSNIVFVLTLLLWIIERQQSHNIPFTVPSLTDNMYIGIRVGNIVSSRDVTSAYYVPPISPIILTQPLKFKIPFLSNIFTCDYADYTKPNNISHLRPIKILHPQYLPI